MEMKGYTDVTAFTTAILEEAGVALVTGAGFGAPENVRLSYATDLDTLKDAVNRLKAFMENKLCLKDENHYCISRLFRNCISRIGNSFQTELSQANRTWRLSC